jgi:hypothetical protein
MRADCEEEHMSLIENTKRERIRELNDAFRKILDPTLGKAVLTAGVNELPSDIRAMAIRKTATFEAFNRTTIPMANRISATSNSVGTGSFSRLITMTRVSNLDRKTHPTRPRPSAF